MPKDKNRRLSLTEEDMITSPKMTRRSLLAGAGVTIGGAAMVRRSALAADSDKKGPDKAEGDKGDKEAPESDRVEHFKGKPAKTLKEAVDNLRTFNKRLEDRLSQELTVKNMDEIHQLSYTLENALKRLDMELGTAAEDLEGMHLASEQLDRKAVEEHGGAYLERIRPLTRAS